MLWAVPVAEPSVALGVVGEAASAAPVVAAAPDEASLPRGRLASLGEALLGIEPTERAVWCLVAIAGVGTLGAAMPTLGEAALVGLGGLGAFLVADFFLAGSPRSLSVTREVSEPLVQGAPAQVTRVVCARRRLDVELTDALPAVSASDGRGGVLEDRFTTGSDETLRVTRDVTLLRRGRHSFGRVTVRTRGPLGLVRRRARHIVSTDVRVLPDLARIGARAERLVRGQDVDGARRRRAPREGREFESLREYTRGDDVRLIEWKASARAGELIVKRLMPETRQDVVILTDTGRHLAGRHEDKDGAEPRLDVAITASLTLAAAALAKGDRVGLLAFAGDVRGFAPTASGRGHLRRLADVVNDHDVLPEEADYGDAVRFLLARQKRRAMVVLVTDVVDEPSARALAAAVAHLRGRHLPVVIALGDPALLRLARGESGDDDETRTREPAEVHLAAQRLLRHRRAALAALSASGAVVVDAPGPLAAQLAVRAYLGVKSTGRL